MFSVISAGLEISSIAFIAVSSKNEELAFVQFSENLGLFIEICDKTLPQLNVLRRSGEANLHENIWWIFSL